MQVRIAQLLVTKQITQNKLKILNVINESKENEWVIFPEGMLSGYYPDDNKFPFNLDVESINLAIQEIQKAVVNKKIDCIFGTAFFEQEKWFNSAIHISANGNINTYHKVNLSTLDRRCFSMGKRLEIFNSNGVNFGIQLCRDITFAEQWKVLKHKGARVVFHINNAIKEVDVRWRHVLATRAFENQFFVVSVNNAEAPQALPSMAISPLANIFVESKPQLESILDITLDLSEVKSDYLNQARTDLVDVIYKG